MAGGGARQRAASHQAAADHLGDDRLARGRGPAHQGRALRPCAGGAGAGAARDRRHDGRPRKYTDLHIFAKEFPDRFYQMGMAEQLLMLAAGGMAHEGFVPFVTTYAAFASRRTFDFISQGDRRGGAERQDLLRPAWPDHGLRPEPPGDRGPRDLPGHAGPHDRRSLRRARHRAGHAGHRRPRRPVYMRLLRGNVPLVLDEYDYRFELGKAKLIRDGARRAGRLLRLHDHARARGRRGAEARPRRRAVLHVPTIKPLDEATILPRPAAAGGSWSWRRTTP